MKPTQFFANLFFGFLIILLLIPIGSGCSRGPRDRALTEVERQLHIESFEKVWTTIRDRHWDPELGGLDWQAVHDELLPSVTAARSEREAIRTIKEMISRLDQSHFGIISANTYDDLGESETPVNRDGSCGIDVRIIEGRAVVTEVEENSAAAEAGVAMGWIIIEADGKKIAPLLEKLSDSYEGKPSQRMMMTGAVLRRLRGAVGASVDVVFLDGEDKKIKKKLLLGPLRGKPYQFGNMPTVNVWIDTTEVAAGVYCIAFNFFFDPARIMAVYNKAISDHLDATGFIVDMRGNPGGLGAMAMGMSGWFVAEKGQQLGTMYMRQSKLNFAISPRAQSFDGPVALLVDGLSASTTEIMSGGLKDIERARVFGAPTAGAALPSVVERLPNGSGFQYAFANYISSGGEVLEGNGVIPHERIELTRAGVLAGRDLVMESAIRWIEQQSGN